MLEQFLKKQELPFILLEDFSQKKLPKEAVHHLRMVLRKKEQIEILIGNGLGNIAKAKIHANNDLVIDEQKIVCAPKPRLHLIQSLVKRKSLEWILQKASEIGVSSITFFLSDYSSSTNEENKKERLQKILLNACMQSRNPFIPKLSFNVFSLMENLQILKEKNSTHEVVWGNWLEPNSSKAFWQNDMKELVQDIYFINGPEGGWSEKEYLYLKNRFRSIQLSNNVLRAETAAITALAVLLYCQNVVK